MRRERIRKAMGLGVVAAAIALLHGCSTSSRGDKTSRTATPLPTATVSNTPLPTFAPSPTFQPTRFVYVAGGYSGGAIASTGSIALGNGGALASGWVAGAPLPAALASGQMAWTGSYLYHLGGLSTGMTDAAYSAAAVAGVIAGWTSQATLPATWSNGALVAFGGFLYLAGGIANASVTSSTYTSWTSGGAMSAWVSTLPLPVTSYDGAFEVHVPHIYYGGGIGGAGGTQVATPTVTATGTPSGSPTPPAEIATFWSTMSSGTLTTWLGADPLPASRRSAAAAVWGDTIYYLGGSDATNATVSTVFRTNVYGGVGGTWQTTTALPVGLRSHRAFAYNGYLFVVGGFPASGPPSSTIYSAAINADYSVGTWTSVGALPAGRASFAAALGD